MLLWALGFGGAQPARQPLVRREHLFRFVGLADLLQFLNWACGLVRTRDELAEADCALSQRLRTADPGMRT